MSGDLCLSFKSAPRAQAQNASTGEVKATTRGMHLGAPRCNVC